MATARKLTDEQLELFTRLDDQKYRLNHLYKIADKNGNIDTFKMNWEQEQIFEEMHFLNVILKPRQIGASTIIDIYSLDCGHFNSNQEFVLTAHKLEDGKKIFKTKILDPFNSMPDGIRRQAEYESKTELVLDNGSAFRVGTSARSSTLQKLHISEFGYICAYNPKKAQEIVSGALNAVGAGQIIWIESTAHGRIGYFYEYCVQAYKIMLMMRALTSMEFKLFFFPWHAHPEYCMDEKDTQLVTLTRDDKEYFEELAAKYDIELTDRQKAWYVQKRSQQKNPENMWREYPSYFEEAFKVSVEGAYYSKELLKAYSEGRIGDHPYDPRLPVHTFWDIGVDDSTSIWFGQRSGPWIVLIDYYQNHGEGVGHYARVLNDKANKLGYVYKYHFGPHDIENREWGNEAAAKRKQSAQKLGINFTTIPRIRYDIEGVEAVRSILPLCRFNQETTDEGIMCLENFRKAWDEKNQVWSGHYIHDQYSHGAKAFESVAFGAESGLGYSEMTPSKAAKLAAKHRPPSSRSS